MSYSVIHSSLLFVLIKMQNSTATHLLMLKNVLFKNIELGIQACEGPAGLELWARSNKKKLEQPMPLQ